LVQNIGLKRISTVMICDEKSNCINSNGGVEFEEFRVNRTI
jgi:hypothetical protein